MSGNQILGRTTSVLNFPFRHAVFGLDLGTIPDGCVVAHLALGCFWGAEKLFWETPGVALTAVGFMGGSTPNPTYREVCTGYTGHAETVRVCYDPAQLSYRKLLQIFLENHNPTQGMRQGMDIGTQYRSAIFVSNPAEAQIAAQVIQEFQPSLTSAGYGKITTQIVDSEVFYFAEAQHQQYLFHNQSGYCPVHATGVKF